MYYIGYNLSNDRSIFLILFHINFNARFIHTLNLLNVYISSICVLISECIDRKGQNIIMTRRIAIQSIILIFKLNILKHSINLLLRICVNRKMTSLLIRNHNMNLSYHLDRIACGWYNLLEIGFWCPQNPVRAHLWNVNTVKGVSASMSSTIHAYFLRIYGYLTCIDRKCSEKHIYTYILKLKSHMMESIIIPMEYIFFFKII